MGVTNLNESQRQALLSRLKQLRTRAVDGDSVATAELNGILKKIVAMYPKNQAAAQYNLGVLYADIRESVEAEKWLIKASSQEFKEAAIELRKLRDRK